jgi:hypothetical protein
MQVGAVNAGVGLPVTRQRRRAQAKVAEFAPAMGIAHGTAPTWKAAARASRRIAQAIEVCACERACVCVCVLVYS